MLEAIERWNEGKQREAAQIETNSAAVFIASIFQQQMVLLPTITAPLHYLHLVFIRPVLTYVLVINGQTCFILLVTPCRGQQKWAMASWNDGLQTFLLHFFFPDYSLVWKTGWITSQKSVGSRQDLKQHHVFQDI